jgi:hypothetical protein
MRIFACYMFAAASSRWRGVSWMEQNISCLVSAFSGSGSLASELKFESMMVSTKMLIGHE